MVDRNGEQSPFQIAKVLHGVDNIAYIAGFIDGEGCVSAYVYGDRLDGRAHFFTRITVSNTNKDVLDFCREVLGCGKVTLVKRARVGNEKDGYVLRICKRSEVKMALSILKPYLVVKRDVADLVLKLIESKPYAKNYFTAQDLALVEEIRTLNKKGRDEQS